MNSNATQEDCTASQTAFEVVLEGPQRQRLGLAESRAGWFGQHAPQAAAEHAPDESHRLPADGGGAGIGADPAEQAALGHVEGGGGGAGVGEGAVAAGTGFEDGMDAFEAEQLPEEGGGHERAAAPRAQIA